MKTYSVSRLVVVLLLGVTLSWSALGLGCNPDLIGTTGGVKHAPIAPGANPYIVLRFTNYVVGPDQNAGEINNPAGANFEASWRYAGGGKDWYGWIGDTLRTGEDFGWVLPCNVTVLTVGDVDDLTDWGAWISYNPLPTPDPDPVRQPLPPFGKLLQNGVDFRCGDVVTFMLEPDNSISERYRVTYRVESGANESGPYTGPDTFANMYAMTKKWETETGISVPYPYIP